MQVRHEKAVIQENSLFREQQYADQREKDYQRSLDLEYEMFEKLRKNFNNSANVQLQQHKDILEEKRQRKVEKITQYCKLVVEQVIELAFKHIDHRRLEGTAEIPKKRLREWKILFANQICLKQNDFVELSKDSIEKVEDDDEPYQQGDSHLSEAIKVLDQSEFLDYIQMDGSWTMGDGPKQNEYLARVVEQISSIASPAQNILIAEDIPKSPLKISVIGKKASGKRSVANMLAQKYGMTMIIVEDLIKDAIA